jgi:hypothetical protein
MNHIAIQRGDNNNAVIAPGLALVFPSGNEPQVEPGWVSPQYGQKISAPVVSVRSKAAEAVFFTLVVPLELNDPLPELRVLTDDATCSDRISFEVTGTGPDKLAIDYVGWAEGTEQFALGTITGTARAAWARASALESESVVQAGEVCLISRTSNCANELLSGAGPLSSILSNEAFGLQHSGGPKR